MKATITVLAILALTQSCYGQSNIIEVAQNLGLGTLKAFLDQAMLTDVLAGSEGGKYILKSLEITSVKKIRFKNKKCSNMVRNKK